MNDFAKWVDDAETDIHYNGRSGQTVWQERFLQIHKELERANKIIDALLKE